MIIGIDIDDTLTFLQNTRILTTEKYIRKNKLNYKLLKKDTHLFSEMFDWPIEENNKFWFKKADKMLAKVKARNYASETIKSFKNNGHKILIITSRTNEWHKNTYKLSYKWLKKNKIYFDKLIVGHLDKTQICCNENVDVFIDDIPSTLTKLQSKKIKTILFKNPHNENQNSYNGQVASNWQEVKSIIENINKKN